MEGTITSSEQRGLQKKLEWNTDRFCVEPFLMADHPSIAPVHTTDLGALFSADCMNVLPWIQSEVVDMVFTDPPFNLGKAYGKLTDDSKSDGEYIVWCQRWLAECVRTLRPGGSLFLYNLPKWNVILGASLNEMGMEFRHWIAIEISACLPIPGRLHPSHYSLLYYSKGKPKTFRRIRTPVQLCRHCGREVKDYGGHRGALNPHGITLKDVWSDIPPVRHWKYKSKNRRANALSTKVLDRVIEMSTVPGDLVLDPFGGSGTTYAVCQSRGRRWIGIEIDFADDIIDRLTNEDVRCHHNGDYVED